jgi:DNA-binding transcriptional MerR regulator
MQLASRSFALADAEPVFTSRDVSRIAQISLRQLQWWDERKLISPRQEGHKRVYLPEQVIQSMVVAELRRKRLTLQKIRRVMRFLRREMSPRLQKHMSSPASGLYLLTDGKSTHLESAPQRVIDLLKNARQAMWLIPVSDLVKRLASEKGSHRSAGQLKLF